MKKVLVSYGTKEYIGSMQLLIDSGREMFDNFFCFQKEDLPIEFLEKHKNIFSQKRGAGYWLWKPFVIYSVMSTLNEGDICFYSDAGNVITNDLSILFEKCINNNGILLFENLNGSLSGEVWKNDMFTKADCFNLMNCTSDKYLYGKQVDAAFQCYQKNEKSINFIKEYLHFCKNENILTDLPNITGENNINFRDHRHDQSVLSLLAIKYDIKLEKCPSQARNSGKAKNEKYDFPIMFFHHKRRLILA